MLKVQDSFHAKRISIKIWGSDFKHDAFIAECDLCPKIHFESYRGNSNIYFCLLCMSAAVLYCQSIY